jgi:hypothetical protein
MEYSMAICGYRAFRIFIAELLLFASALAQQAPATLPHLTIDQAKRLVISALEENGATKLKNFNLELMKNSLDPSFYSFEATWNNAKGGSNIIGHYVVDPQTGDVWNGITYDEITSPSLRRLQRSMQSRLGITPSTYRKLRRPGPMCDEDEFKP